MAYWNLVGSDRHVFSSVTPLSYSLLPSTFRVAPLPTVTPFSNSSGSPSASPHPAMIFFISFSAQAMESLVDVPVTALASMLGRMYELVISWTLSEAGAGQP